MTLYPWNWFLCFDWGDKKVSANISNLVGDIIWPILNFNIWMSLKSLFSSAALFQQSSWTALSAFHMLSELNESNSQTYSPQPPYTLVYRTLRDQLNEEQWHSCNRQGKEETQFSPQAPQGQPDENIGWYFYSCWHEAADIGVSMKSGRVQGQAVISSTESKPGKTEIRGKKAHLKGTSDCF